jgi:hypothetical protein
MPEVYAPILGPTYTVSGVCKQVMAAVTRALVLAGGVLFVVTLTGDEYEISVRFDQRHILDNILTAAGKHMTPSLSVFAEDAHLEQVFEDRIGGVDTD